jgi:hypothetical protein
MYTTKLDKSTPDYAHFEAAGEKMAREIEKQKADNIHLRKEGGHQMYGLNEEQQYSEVTKNRPVQNIPTNVSVTKGLVLDIYKYVPHGLGSHYSQRTGTSMANDSDQKWAHNAPIRAETTLQDDLEISRTELTMDILVSLTPDTIRLNPVTITNAIIQINGNNAHLIIKPTKEEMISTGRIISRIIVHEIGPITINLNAKKTKGRGPLKQKAIRRKWRI